MKRGAEQDINPRPTISRIDEIQQIFNSYHMFDMERKFDEMIANDSLTLTDLIYQMPDGPHEGQSVLYVAARTLYSSGSKSFMRVFGKFKNQLPLAALLAPVKEGSFMLEGLAHGISWDPQPFLSIWERFKNELTFDALLI